MNSNNWRVVIEILRSRANCGSARKVYIILGELGNRFVFHNALDWPFLLPAGDLASRDVLGVRM